MNLFYRKLISVNTDPLKRCYNGCNFSERVEWSDWELIDVYKTKDEALSAANIFRSINPTRQYEVRE